MTGWTATGISSLVCRCGLQAGREPGGGGSHAHSHRHSRGAGCACCRPRCGRARAGAGYVDLHAQRAVLCFRRAARPRGGRAACSTADTLTWLELGEISTYRSSSRSLSDLGSSPASAASNVVAGGRVKSLAALHSGADKTCGSVTGIATGSQLQSQAAGAPRVEGERLDDVKAAPAMGRGLRVVAQPLEAEAAEPPTPTASHSSRLAVSDTCEAVCGAGCLDEGVGRQATRCGLDTLGIPS